MARGLSELQKNILKIGYGNCNRGFGTGNVTNREVLIEVYKFQPIYSLEEKRNGATIFDRKAIGINRYKAASVSVTKAFDRVTERGLATRKYNHGIILTEEGSKVARALKKR
jgi:hypothetical protein